MDKEEIKKEIKAIEERLIFLMNEEDELRRKRNELLNSLLENS